MSNFSEFGKMIPEYPLLNRDPRLQAMAKSAVVIGNNLLASSRMDYSMPRLAEQQAASIIFSFDSGAIVHGKQYQSDVNLSSGDYFLIHGVNGYLNYLRGMESWDVSLAWVKDNKIQAGVVYVPEVGRLYYAGLNEGAYLNGDKLELTTERPLKQALIEVAPLFDRGSADKREGKAVLAIRRTIEELADIHKVVTRENQSGGKSLAELAERKLDAYASSWTSEGNLPPGVLIARESGIIVTNIEGEEWQPGTLGVIAATPELHPVWLEMLQKHYR